MIEVLKEGHNIILRFESGEDVIAGLVRFARDKGVTGGYFTGIGACNLANLGYYHLTSRNYVKIEIAEEMEIVSLTGNLAVLDGNPVVHCHGAFSKSNFDCVGGHVFKAIVSATCEISITVLNNRLNRRPESKTGLNLLE